MNYSELVTQLGNLLQYEVVDATLAAPYAEDSANIMLPGLLTYMNRRICRDMNFLYQQTQNAANAMTVGQRLFVLPATIVVVSGLAYITPAGAMPSLGKINRIDFCSLDWLDSVYPQESIVGPPKWGALRDNASILLGPSPDQAYKAQVTGEFIPEPISATNTTTYIGDQFPELMLCASMVFGAGFERDYGSQSDDPKLATSWEGQYQILIPGAKAEEMRRKQLGMGWTAPASSTRG